MWSEVAEIEDGGKMRWVCANLAEADCKSLSRLSEQLLYRALKITHGSLRRECGRKEFKMLNKS